MPFKYKQLIIMSLMMVLCLPVFAEFVQPEQAIRVAANWLNHWQREQISMPNFSEIHSYNLGTVSRIDSDRKYNEDLNPIPELYLVYFEDGGYAVVPADDNLRPVLVYSHTGLEDKSDFPPAFKMWLSFYAGDVRYARDSQVFIAENRALWQDVERGTMNYFPREREVGELLSTNWNQGWPYNELCPLDSEGPGGRVYAGCVATAMAQVMKYWNKPVTGQGSNSYYAVGYGYQSANFGATTYLWDEMPNSISSSNLPIATLLYHCAVSVNMSFAPDGSGSNGMLARAAMQNNFRYPNASYVQKQNYNTTNWENLLKAQLDEGVPMYYSGSDTQVGHAWNCDGYQGSDYFHFNFGWSGSYNGYYYLNSINPGSNNLNLNQAAIINAVPANYTISQPRIQILAGNSVAGDPFELKLTTYPVLSSWNVTDYGFTLFYDHTTMEYMGSSLDGTISEGGDLQVLTSEPGYLNVSWNRSEALFGGGDLVKFEFRALEPGDYYFDAVDMAYNSNSLINIDHLITHIPAPVASLAESTISLNNAMQIGYNQVATQNLSTSYLLPSWNVTHYEFDLGYNPEKVQFEAVVSEGTLSEIADNVLATVTSPGTVHVSCDTSVPITGLGSLLLKIQFRAIGNGSTSSATVISISNFMYNDTAILHTSNAYILLSPLTSIDEDFPQAISGLNNYPNPFNPSTTISFSLQRPGEVSLAIYNLKGQKIKTLLEGKMTGGTHQIVWNGKDNAGQAAPSGIYLYRLQADGKNQTGKMVMMK